MNPLNKKSFLFFGGGSGLSNILKPFVNSLRDDIDYNLSIIVSTFDNGGSTGIIRSEKKIPALGDLRKVISSLSSASESIFLEYRSLNKPLSPHTVGNIFLDNFYGFSLAFLSVFIIGLFNNILKSLLFEQLIWTNNISLYDFSKHFWWLF